MRPATPRKTAVLTGSDSEIGNGGGNISALEADIQSIGDETVRTKHGTAAPGLYDFLFHNRSSSSAFSASQHCPVFHFSHTARCTRTGLRVYEFACLYAAGLQQDLRPHTHGRGLLCSMYLGDRSAAKDLYNSIECARVPTCYATPSLKKSRWPQNRSFIL